MATVLIVDDHALVRAGFVGLLNAMPGINVVGEAGTAAEAIEETARLRPGLVLLDYQLPDGDGIAACPGLLAAHPKSRVLMLTQFPTGRLARRALEAGAAGFVGKVSDLNTLVEAMRTVMAGGRFVDPVVEKAQGLSERELDILSQLAHGRSTCEIAEDLCISTWSVQTYVERAMRKLGARNRGAAIATAVRRGLA